MMPEGENEQEHRWQGEDGKSFRMMWQLFRPGYGNTVELTTGGRPCGRPLEMWLWLGSGDDDAWVQSRGECTARGVIEVMRTCGSHGRHVCITAAHCGRRCRSRPPPM